MASAIQEPNEENDNKNTEQTHNNYYFAFILRHGKPEQPATGLYVNTASCYNDWGQTELYANLRLYFRAFKLTHDHDMLDAFLKNIFSKNCKLSARVTVPLTMTVETVPKI